MTLLRLNAVERTIIIIAIIMIIGGALSITTTTNHDWTSLHLSRLGEGRALSSYFFNATVAFSALALLEFGNVVSRNKLWRAKTSIPQRRVFHVVFRLIAVCLVGLSIFPYDKFPLVHDIFGYGMTVIYIAAVAYFTRCSAVFRTPFIKATWVIVGVMLAMFMVYFIFGNRQITLLQIQALGLIFFFAWMVALAHGLQPVSSNAQHSKAQ